MKTFKLIHFLLILFFLNGFSATAQSLMEKNVQFIEPYPLRIAFAKTTNLIFPFAIKSVDKGSQDVLAQKANGVENILQIKAGKEGFKETNLTVITAQGKIYSFLVNYDQQPEVLNLMFHQHPATLDYRSLLTESTDDLKVEELAAIVAHKSKRSSSLRDREQGLTMSLEGIYIQGDVMYFHIRMSNESNINYHFDQLRFFIQDHQKTKRMATQEVEMVPLHIYNPTGSIMAQSEQVLVYALDKITIPGKKRLKLQVMEENGGRNLELMLKNRTLMKSIPLPDLSGRP